MQNQHGFSTLYEDLYDNRVALREREAPVNIMGISQMLESRSSLLSVHIIRYVNHLESADITINVSSRSAKASDVDAAQRAEDFDYSFLSEITRQHVGGVKPWRRHLDDAMAYGLGFLALRLKPKILEELGTDFDTPEEMASEAERIFKDGFTENPFIVECPQFGTVFFEPNMDRFAEIGERVLSSVLASYDGLEYTPDGFEYVVSETIQEFDNSWDTTVKTYHLETSDYIYDIVEHPRREDAFALDVRPNILGRPWYSVMFGDVDNNPDVSKKYKPPVWPLYDLVQTLNVTDTLIQSGALNTGRPMYQEVQANGRALAFPDLMADRSERAPAIIFDPSESVLKKPARGSRWELVPAPDIQQLIEANNRTLTAIKETGFPSDLGPDSGTVSNDTSAARGSQRIEVSGNQLEASFSNAEQSLNDLLDLVGDAIKNLKVPVTLPVRRRAQGGSARVRESVTIRPEDYKEQDREITFKNVPAATRMAWRKSNTDALKDGLMSRTRWLRAEYDDPVFEAKMIVIDKAYAVAEEEALKAVIAFMKKNGEAIAAQAAAELGVSPPPLAPQDGGPPPGETVRPTARPPLGSFTGAGIAPGQVEQAGPDGVLPSVAEGVQQ